MSLEIKQIRLPNTNSPLAKLDDAELEYLAEVKNSETFKILGKVLEAIDTRYSRRESMRRMNEQINAYVRLGYDRSTATLLVHQEINGRIIEDDLILSIPQLAQSELARRRKQNEQEK